MSKDEAKKKYGEILSTIKLPHSSISCVFAEGGSFMVDVGGNPIVM